jgi:hypothetical protein
MFFTERLAEPVDPVGDGGVELTDRLILAGLRLGILSGWQFDLEGCLERVSRVAFDGNFKMPRAVWQSLRIAGHPPGIG